MDHLAITLVGALLATLSIGALHHELPSSPRLAAVRMSDDDQSSIPRVSLTGTYRIVLCSAAICLPSDTTRADVWGELVLTDAPLPDSVRQRFPDTFLRGAPNGCYSLRRRRSVRSLAGLESEALTFWERKKETVSFTLYRSPDAAHDVNGTASGDTLQGIGHSWETPAASMFPVDFVRAIRIGPADVRRCSTTKHRAGGV